MYDVITIGAATQDVFLTSEGFHVMHSPKLKRRCECFPLGEKINVEHIDFETGGGATNAAATFRNLGFRVGVIAKVGEDTAGREVLKDLRQRRIQTGLIRTVKGGATGFSAILLTPHGDRTALVHRGVSASFGVSDIPWGKLNVRWLFVTSLAGNLKLLSRLFAVACARGIKIAFNPGMQELQCGLAKMRAHCRAAHMLFLNRSEAEALAGGERDPKRLCRRLHTHFQNAVIITDGSRGAYYYDHSQFIIVRTRRVKVVNSTGAGDAFGAGFISGILRWRDPARALQLATLNAEGTIQHMGAKRGLLTRWPVPAQIQRITIKRYSVYA